jgi:hypothetical protein
MLKWTNAQTVDVCKECGSDIWPADRILMAHWGSRMSWGVLYTIEIFCEDCGKIYETEAKEDAKRGAR